MSIFRKKAFQYGVTGVLVTLVFGYLFYRAHILDEKALQSRRYSWENDKTYVYDVNLEQKGWTSFEKAWASQDSAEAKPIPYDVKLQDSTARLIVLDKDEKATHFALILATAAVDFVLADKSRQFTESARVGLKEAVYFSLGKRGGISQLMFSPKSTTVSRNLARTFLNETLPQLRSGRFEEPHRSDARWVQQQVKEFGPLRIKKVVENYATDRLVAAQKRSKLDGSFQYNLGEGSIRLVTAEGYLHAQNFSGENQVQDEETVLTVRLVQEEATDKLLVADLLQAKKNAFSGSLHGKEEFKESEQAILQNRIAGLDFKTKLQEFINLGSSVRIVDSYRLYEILLDFLKIHPELAQTILEQMQELEGKDSRFDIFAMLMLQSGNPDLQSKLIDFAKDHWDDESKVNQILFNFALDKNLDSAMTDKLVQIYDQTAQDDPNYSNITMHLGSIGHEAIDPEVKDAVRERIEKGLNEQKRTEDKRPYVVALGNLGHPNTLEVAQPYVSSNNVRERQFGAEMLRRVEGPGSEASKQTLLNLAGHDPEIAVRRDASKYLDDKQYQGDQLEQIKSLLFHEKDPNVAMNLIDVLGKGELDRAGAIAILQDYYKQCAHPEVCKKVEGIILGKRK